jgi:hypothetical protein
VVDALNVQKENPVEGITTELKPEVVEAIRNKLKLHPVISTQ